MESELISTCLLNNQIISQVLEVIYAIEFISDALLPEIWLQWFVSDGYKVDFVHKKITIQMNVSV